MEGGPDASQERKYGLQSVKFSDEESATKAREILGSKESEIRAKVEAEEEGYKVDKVFVHRSGNTLWIEVIGTDKWDQQIKFNPDLEPYFEELKSLGVEKGEE